ncbi:MAG: DUF6912 family protein [Nocardioidaceae bacterium]
MRVYAPLSAEGLLCLQAKGILAGPVEAVAATEHVRARLAGVSEEEAEYAVTTAAAETSLAQLRESGATTGRRIVVVAEVPTADVSEPDACPPDEPTGQVVVHRDIEPEEVAALLADAEPIDLCADPGAELAWFATSEIAALLA